MSKIIREIKGEEYELTFSKVVNEGGKQIKQSRWMSVKPKEDGTFKILDYNCTVPEGYTDIDLSTLNEDCLTGSSYINQNALIK